jgi:hypothetical protein
MKWWCFNEQQLANALETWRNSRNFIASGDASSADIIDAFLKSPEARGAGLRGDKELDREQAQ